MTSEPCAALRNDAMMQSPVRAAGSNTRNTARPDGVSPSRQTFSAASFGAIAAKHIENLATVVFTAWKLAIAIVVSIAAWIRKPFQLVAFRVAYQLEVGISVAARLIIVLCQVIKTCLEPVLEVKFFVVSAFTLNENIGAHGRNAMFEDRANETHERPPVELFLLIS